MRCRPARTWERAPSPDRYEQASADLTLVSDPLTQDRYAFAGGNPVNLVEWDGHEPASSFRNGCDNTYGSSYACGREGGGSRRGRARRSRSRAYRGQERYARNYSSNWPEGRRNAQEVRASRRGQVRAPEGCRSDMGCSQGDLHPRPAAPPQAAPHDEVQCLVPVEGYGCQYWHKRGQGDNPFLREDSQAVHRALEIGGLAGWAPDVLNALAYAAEGDMKNAARAAAEGTPIGPVVAGVRGVRKGARGGTRTAPADRVGRQREARVAEITSGRVAREEVVMPNVGRTDVDVVGRNGELIAVGGPAKRPSDVGRRLQILRYAAEQRGVAAMAYFEKGTPNEVLAVAQRHLGPGNVRTFDRETPR